ncbi:unnamed protein product, partial [Closterium sp. NIES-54]
CLTCAFSSPAESAPLSCPPCMPPPPPPLPHNSPLLPSPASPTPLSAPLLPIAPFHPPLPPCCLKLPPSDQPAPQASWKARTACTGLLNSTLYVVPRPALAAVPLLPHDATLPGIIITWPRVASFPCNCVSSAIGASGRLGPAVPPTRRLSHALMSSPSPNRPPSATPCVIPCAGGALILSATASHVDVQRVDRSASFAPSCGLRGPPSSSAHVPIPRLTALEAEGAKVEFTSSVGAQRAGITTLGATVALSPQFTPTSQWSIGTSRESSHEPVCSAGTLTDLAEIVEGPADHCDSGGECCGTGGGQGRRGGGSGGGADIPGKFGAKAEGAGGCM